MSWSPQPEILEQLRLVFLNSLSPDNTLRGLATKTLEEARRTQRDLNNYLVNIFVTPTSDAEIHLRASAGIMLKNNVLAQYDAISREPAVIEYIKENIVIGLSQPVAMIRNIAGSVVSAVVSKGSFQSWPDILPKLMAMTNHDNTVVQEGALSALAKLFEDSGSELDSDPEGQRVLSFMIPRFIELARSPSPKVRSLCIVCLNQFILRMSQALFVHIDAFLTTLFQLAVDTDPDVRKNICTAFVMLLDVREEKLVPHLEGIVNYSLHCMGDDDEQVALEACEFLLGLAEHDRLRNQVSAFLPKILPVLFRCMVYSEQDILRFESMAEDDARMEDKATDIRPTHAKSRNAHNASHFSAENNKSGNGTGNDDGEFDDDDDDDEDEDDDDYSMDISDWNLRKCSAAALDIFASSYHERILEFSLPTLKQNLVSHEWPVREAAILAYGAIAEGCVDGMSPFLPEVIPYFVQALGDPVAPIRQITCWTLGRYSSWICYRSADIGYEQEFIPVLTGLLKCCLDNNKKVQEAGCSGFANFADQAGGLLVPYLMYILQNLTLCFLKYQSKNLAILYDAVQTLVDKVGYAMKSKEYIDLLLPPLIERWQKLSDDDTDLFPLLECLSSVTAALGEHFAPYAEPVFQRAVKILHDNLVMAQEASNDPTLDSPDKDFIVTALDLLDGLVQGLGSLSVGLVNQSQYPLMQMILACLNDPVHEVRQSAFALLGDMAIGSFDVIKAYIPAIMTELIPQIDSGDPSCSAVCNNATWAAGEIALKLGEDVRPYVAPLMEKLVVVVAVNGYVEQTIVENAAITIGRLGISCPDVIAPRLETFAAYWCKALRIIRDTDEKESAFKGMCKIVVVNPNGLQGCLPEFIEAIGMYTEPSDELLHMFSTILSGYRGLVGDWDQVIMSQISDEVRQTLRDRYDV
ncbi:karyopherin Kap104 [Myxozyma melibiosi]|uniref:Karyopherin Kap104 n=1 Tax=Myxozyma melibiosi TaxID=54550 RepID=A0ABR1F247_9ASCO